MHIFVIIFRLRINKNFNHLKIICLQICKKGIFIHALVRNMNVKQIEINKSIYKVLGIWSVLKCKHF